MLDTDLDGGEYADQLKSLLHRINPIDESANFFNLQTPEVKNTQTHIHRTESEKIMDLIHGTYIEPPQIKRKIQTPIKHQRMHKLPQQPPSPTTTTTTTTTERENNKINFVTPKIFGQSVITQTIRRPDGVRV